MQALDSQGWGSDVSYIQTPRSPQRAREGTACTPITAFLIQPSVRREIESIVRPIHSESHGVLIPICRYGANLEPSPDCSDPRVIAAVDDRRGLQILLLEINGRTKGKDGIPYHAIWSYDPAIYRDIVVDEEYRWPVSQYEIANLDLVNFHNTTFNIVTRDVRYKRVLPHVELAAESLARTAHAHRDEQTFSGNDFDFFKVNISASVKPIARALDSGTSPTSIRPDLFRVDFEASGKRTMTPVTWDTPRSAEDSWYRLVNA